MVASPRLAALVAVGLMAAACGSSQTTKANDAFTDPHEGEGTDAAQPHNLETGSPADGLSGSVSEVGGEPSPATLLLVNPPSVVLGLVEVGTRSSAVEVTVSNPGTAASGPLTVTVAGAGIAATGCAGVRLAPKASCTISVTAQLTAPGPVSGMIEVGDSPATSKKIAVSGGGPTPATFSLAPSPLDLGLVAMGKSATSPITMTNLSSRALTGINIAVSGNGFSAGSGTCTDTLAAASDCTIVVNFQASTTQGSAKGTVNVVQGGVVKTVIVLATVQTAANLVMTPTSGSFQTTMGTPSDTVVFHVANTGDANSSVPVVTISGPNQDDFSFLTDCTAPLVALATCQIKVVYAPKTTTTSKATATLTVSIGGASGSAPLTGVAMTGGGLDLSGYPTNLGDVTAGTQGSPALFTLTNRGVANSGLITVTVDAPQYVVGNNRCAEASLDPGQNCTFTVQFNPSAEDLGVIAGRITVQSAAAANPTLLVIAGTAVLPATLTVQPALLDFGTILVEQESTPLTLTVSRTGGTPTGALMVDIIGAPFAIKGGTCNGAILTSRGEASTCVLVVSFTAAATATESTGKVVFSEMGVAPVTAGLRGTSTLPAP